jgi:hypothetical protein
LNGPPRPGDTDRGGLILLHGKAEIGETFLPNAQA